MTQIKQKGDLEAKSKDGIVFVNTLPRLPYDRYILALERLKVIIESSDKPTGFDISEIGHKETACSWGLCSKSKQLWPDPQDYIWPLDTDRVAPLYRHQKQTCPLDHRRKPNGMHGCFYDCCFFQNKIPMMSKNEILTKIDKLIKKTLKLKDSEEWEQANKRKYD